MENARYIRKKRMNFSANAVVLRIVVSAQFKTGIMKSETRIMKSATRIKRTKKNLTYLLILKMPTKWLRMMQKTMMMLQKKKRKSLKLICKLQQEKCKK